MGDVFDALNRTGPGDGDEQTRPSVDSGSLSELFEESDGASNEQPGLPLAEVEGIARIKPGQSIFNDQPVDMRLKPDERIATGAQFRQPVPGGCTPKVVAHTDRTSPTTEQYRQIRTQILARGKEKSHKTYLFTSTAPQEGKSVTTVNLGVVFAELRRARTLLIEADLRRPTFHRLFDRSFDKGLLHLLRGDVELQTEAIHPTVYDNLHIIPAGAHDGEAANELLSSQAMFQLIDRLRDDYDHILIDSPPVLSVSDSCILGAHCDQTLMVVRMHKTSRQEAKQAKRHLENAGCALAGTILTHARDEQVPRYYYQDAG